jgi:hypothetical protein
MKSAIKNTRRKYRANLILIRIHRFLTLIEFILFPPIGSYFAAVSMGLYRVGGTVTDG